MRPWELARLTFHELAQLGTAWVRREEARKAELAQLLAWLISPHMKKSVSPDEFLLALIGTSAFERRKLAEIAAAKAAT